MMKLSEKALFTGGHKTRPYRGGVSYSASTDWICPIRPIMSYMSHKTYKTHKSYKTLVPSKPKRKGIKKVPRPHVLGK